MPNNRDVEPLRPLVFQILLLLNDAQMHGYGLMQAINEDAGRNVILGPATLYRTIKELRDEGLIEETSGDGDRRRVYRLTEKGEDTARGEAKRMASIVERARAGRLI